MSHGSLSVAALTSPTIADAVELIVECFALLMPLFALSVHPRGVSTGVRLGVRWPLDPEVERFPHRHHGRQPVRAAALPAGRRAAEGRGAGRAPPAPARPARMGGHHRHRAALRPAALRAAPPRCSAWRCRSRTSARTDRPAALPRALGRAPTRHGWPAW
ncbi:MAG: hypothetical protein IPH72_19155 [Sandaracinaceae bacterium]|nr:hypothetical protein [Sandaracinaceae bacterium]